VQRLLDSIWGSGQIGSDWNLGELVSLSAVPANHAPCSGEQGAGGRSADWPVVL